MTNEEYRKLIESRGRKLISKVPHFTFPRDKDGNRIAGWFIGEDDGEVYFVSPNVRGVGRLTGHSIEPNGDVNASVLVKGTGYEKDENGHHIDAEYHEFVVLDDWDANYRKNAGEAKPSQVNNNEKH